MTPRPTDPGAVTVLYFDGCPHWQLADKHLREALAYLGRADTAIEYRQITTPEQAEAVQFHGSPTVLLDGHDPFPAPSEVGLSCRVYRTPDGLAGSPSIEQVVEALRKASHA